MDTHVVDLSHTQARALAAYVFDWCTKTGVGALWGRQLVFSSPLAAWQAVIDGASLAEIDGDRVQWSALSVLADQISYTKRGER